jgi:hypothetical protein
MLRMTRTGMPTCSGTESAMAATMAAMPRVEPTTDLDPKVWRAAAATTGCGHHVADIR